MVRIRTVGEPRRIVATANDVNVVLGNTARRLYTSHDLVDQLTGG